MRSKENEMNFTDYKRLNCYRYIEENDTIEEAFYQSNDSKLCKFSQPVFTLFPTNKTQAFIKGHAYDNSTNVKMI